MYNNHNAQNASVYTPEILKLIFTFVPWVDRCRCAAASVTWRHAFFQTVQAISFHGASGWAAYDSTRFTTFIRECLKFEAPVTVRYVLFCAHSVHSMLTACMPAQHFVAPGACRFDFAITGFAHLSDVDCSRKRLTREQLQRILRLPSLRRLHLFDASALNGLSLSGVVLPGLDCLTIARNDATSDRTLQIVARCTSLQELSIPGCSGKVSSTGMKLLANLTSLTTCNISQMAAGVTTSSLACCCQAWSRLQTLCARGVNSMDESALREIARCRGLRRLDVSYCVAVGDTALAHLQDMPCLQELRLSGCRSITDVGLGYVARIPALQRLAIDACQRLTDGCVEALNSVHLLELNVSHICDIKLTSLVGTNATLQELRAASCNNVAAHVFAKPSPLTSLRLLDLHNCAQLRDEHVANVVQCLQLRWICFERCRLLTWRTAKYLTALPELLHLNVGRCVRMDDIAAVHLKRLPRLVTLDVTGCPLTPNALAVLEQCVNLQQLHWAGMSYRRQVSRYVCLICGALRIGCGCS